MTTYSWKPSETVISTSNIARIMRSQKISTYEEFWRWSVKERAAFWDSTIKELQIPFKKPYATVFDLKNGVTSPNWLPNAELNIVDACFQNEGAQTAIVFQKEGEHQVEKMTQSELEKLANRIANSLLKMGLEKGDRIAIDLPMTVEAVAIYLAAIKAGMPVVTVADSFTPKEIEVRLKITSPRVIFTQDVIQRAGKELPLYSKVREAKAPKAVVINVSKSKIDLRTNDVLWSEFLVDTEDFESVSQKPEDLITVLFSSGTTGEPKAIPWNHTTPIKCASDGFYHQNIQEGDVVCWPTNLGWMMGPWLVFAALMNKASIALYYGAPVGAGFGSFIQNAEVSMLGVIPSFVKSWKDSACMELYNWSAIKCFSSTGEVSSPSEMAYLMQLANDKPVIEYCGGTEIGGGYITSTVVQENFPSTFSTKALGTDFVLLDEHHKPSKEGEVFLIPPSMGLSNSLLNRDHYKVYFEGTPTYKNQILRRHGDQMLQLENGYFKAEGRVDDAMNLGGIKVSSVQIESVVNKLSFVLESAAVAVPPKYGGPSALVIFIVKGDAKIDETAAREQVVRVIKTDLNPLFKVKDLKMIDKLPRTASNKIMRRKLRSMYEE